MATNAINYSFKHVNSFMFRKRAANVINSIFKNVSNSTFQKRWRRMLTNINSRKVVIQRAQLSFLIFFRNDDDNCQQLQFTEMQVTNFYQLSYSYNSLKCQESYFLEKFATDVSNYKFSKIVMNAINYSSKHVNNYNFRKWRHML